MLEWNDQPLRNLSRLEVTEIILESKRDTHVQLVVCRRYSKHLLLLLFFSSKKSVIFQYNENTRCTLLGSISNILAYVHSL